MKEYVVFILRRDGRLLLHRRVFGGVAYWRFPGGEISAADRETPDSLLACLHRSLSRLIPLILLLGFALAPAAYGDSSDFGFKPMHEKIRYKEDFFRIYSEWLYADLDSTSRNIFFLELAYVVEFDHPIRAMVPITNELQYERYKNLMMMHICQLLTQSYINYGYMYFKEHIYFFNEEFKKDYLDGYDIAEKYFKDAREYWRQAVEYAKKADALWMYKTDLVFQEDMIYKIKSGQRNYYKVIDNLFYRIARNRAEIERRWGTNAGGAQ